MKRFSAKDTATILAALRFWQRQTEPKDRDCFGHFEDVRPLRDDEIDELCEKINLSLAFPIDGAAAWVRLEEDFPEIAMAIDFRIAQRKGV